MAEDIEQAALLREVEQLQRLIHLDDEMSQTETDVEGADRDLILPSVAPVDMGASAVFATTTTTTVMPSQETSMPSERQVEGSGQLAGPLVAMTNLRRCLDLNLNYQTIVRKYIGLIRQARAKLQEQMNDHLELISEEKDAKLTRECSGRFVPVIHRPTPPTILAFRKPYFKFVYGMYPSPNEDVKAKSFGGELLPDDLTFDSGWRWYDESMKERLFREVRRECLSKLLEPYINQRDELRSLVGDLEGPAAQAAHRDLEEIERMIKKTARETDTEELFNNKILMQRVDWMKIAKNLGGSVNHLTCRLVWENYHSPAVNKQPFKRSEDTKLVQLVNLNKKRRWLKVSESLQTKRSAFQCLQRYQSKLMVKPGQKDVKDDEARVVWRKEDEDRLLGVVASLNVSDESDPRGISQFIDWQFVAQNVGPFSKMECCEKFILLSSKRNHGPWSKGEDRLLREAMETYGSSKWEAVASYVATRTAKQCAQHWTLVITRRRIAEMLEKHPPPEWTAEEDAILWHNRNSKDPALCKAYSEISRLLPSRHKFELQMRYRLLTRWFKQAAWLTRNENTLLSLIVKSDSELTMGEIARLRSEVARIQTKRRKVKPAKMTAEEQERFHSISLAERGQLENLVNAMVLEASLSRDLVREKVTLVRDIVAFRAVPVPLLRQTTSYSKLKALDNKSEVFEKIKEMLIQQTVARQKKQNARTLQDANAAQAEIDETDRALDAAIGKETKHGKQSFGSIMKKIRDAASNPRLADCARQILLKLEKVNGGTSVKNLLKISKQLDALSRKVRPHMTADTRATFNEWMDLRRMIANVFRERSVSAYVRDPTTHVFGRTRFRRYYEQPMTTSSLKVTVPPSDSVGEVTKMLVQSLGTNLEGVIAEATSRRDADCAIELDDSGSVNLAASLGVHITPNFSVEKGLALSRLHASEALQALEIPTGNTDSARGPWKSIQDEFDATVHCLPDDFVACDGAPVFPPTGSTCAAYRILSLSKLRLQDIVNDSCDEAQRSHLLETVRKLKEHPTEGYALLQRRFEALFSWPALIAKVPPEFIRRLPFVSFRKPAPPTPADVTEAEAPDSSADDWESEDEAGLKVKRHLPAGDDHWTKRLEGPFLSNQLSRDDPNWRPFRTAADFAAATSDPRSERIKKLREEGRLPKSLAEPQRRVTWTRSQILAKRNEEQQAQEAAGEEEPQPPASPPLLPTSASSEFVLPAGRKRPLTAAECLALNRRTLMEKGQLPPALDFSAACSNEAVIEAPFEQLTPLQKLLKSLPATEAPKSPSRAEQPVVEPTSRETSKEVEKKSCGRRKSSRKSKIDDGFVGSEPEAKKSKSDASVVATTTGQPQETVKFPSIVISEEASRVLEASPGLQKKIAGGEVPAKKAKKSKRSSRKSKSNETSSSSSGVGKRTRSSEKTAVEEPSTEEQSAGSVQAPLSEASTSVTAEQPLAPATVAAASGNRETPAPAVLPSTMLPTSGQQQVAVIQLTQEDILRLFSGGAPSVAIAVTLPQPGGSGGPSVLALPTSTPQQNNN